MWRYIRHYTVVSLIYAVTALMLFTVSRPVPVAATLPVITHAKPRPLPPRLATQGMPTHVNVPSVGIDLPVKEGAYDEASATWLVDHSAAFFAPLSVVVNDNNGTSLIYAHAQSGLFETLPNITQGAEAIIKTNNGHTFHYTYQSMRLVDPSDVSVFQVDGPPLLVLQTCMGDWSQYRALFTFTLTRVE